MKEINRNINFEGRQITSPYRCKYKKNKQASIDFNVVRINISLGSESHTYEIESRYLNKDTDSISFKAFKKGGSFDIQWSPKEIIPYIKQIK